LHEDDVKMFWGSRRTQPTVDCLWSMVSSFPGLSVNSDNLPLSYVIMFLYSLICHYMYENRSFHTYSYAFGFLWKTGVTSMDIQIMWNLYVMAYIYMR
jgi:hypothetical protein